MGFFPKAGFSAETHGVTRPRRNRHPVFQAAQRAKVQNALRAHCLDLYDAHGQSTGPREREWRGRLWLSLAFLGGEDAPIRRANALLRVAAPMGGGHFWSSAVSSVLSRFADKLEADVRDALTVRLQGMIAEESRQRFRGYNDNFPAMAALAALVGGPLVIWPSRSRTIVELAEPLTNGVPADRPDREILALWEGDRVVAHAMTFRRVVLCEGGRELPVLALGGVCVDPALRGRGLGSEERRCRAGYSSTR
jgi:hypothetical protein